MRPLTFLAWYMLGSDTRLKTPIYDLSLSWLGTGLVTIPLKHKYMISHFPGLVQLRLGNDTLKTQIYDLSLSWLGTGLVPIPLKHKYMISHFPGLVQAWKRYH
jgi:hypothetical protein